MNKGAVLKSLIKKSNLTQRKVATELGMRETYLSTLLKNPDLADEFIEKTCEILGIDPIQHFEIKHKSKADLQQRYEKLQEKHEQLLDKHFTEKAKWLDQLEALRQEIHTLKGEILELRK